MNIEHKIKKYSNKLTLKPKYKYLRKLSEYILIKYNTQTGGRVINFEAGDDYSSKVAGLLYLIKDTIEPLKSIPTNRKYCMIVMGPTGSGKTLARKIGFNLVHELEPKSNIDAIEKSFIDISVDDYVYGVNINGKTGKDALKDKAEEILLCLRTKTGKTNEDIIKESANIKPLSKESYNEYSKYRINIDAIPMIMVYIATHLRLNFIFETVSGEWLPKFMRDNIPDYFQVVVYPSTNQENLIIRTASRALDEYRFVNPENFPMMIANADKMFNNLLESSDYPNMYLYKYNNNDGNIDEIKAGNFSSLPLMQRKLS
jgi:hypothetical protein